LPNLAFKNPITVRPLEVAEEAEGPVAAVAAVEQQLVEMSSV
jgi:hypothetical protein